MLLGDARASRSCGWPSCRSASRSCGGTAATTSPSRATWNGSCAASSALGGVFLFVCVGGPDRDGARAAAAALLVGRRGAGVRRRSGCCSPSSRPVPDAGPDAAAKTTGSPRRRTQLAREQGVPDIPVEVEDVDEFTDEPNAFAIGLGPTRRVILWNTLLERPFSDREVRVVIAHELGHHSRDHLWKLSGWFALVALPVAWRDRARHPPPRRDVRAAGRAARAAGRAWSLQIARHPGPERRSSRRYEAEADWVALQTTRDPRAARASSRGAGGEEPHRPGPARMGASRCSTPIRRPCERIAMAEAWRARNAPPARVRLAPTHGQPRKEVTWKPPRRHQQPRRRTARRARPTIRSASTSSTRSSLSRWKIFVKWLLAIPHFIIVYLLLINVAGDAGVHRLLRDPVHEEVAARHVRLHRSDLALDGERLAYALFLLRDEYPPFSGDAGRVPGDARGRLRRGPVALA